MASSTSSKAADTTPAQPSAARASSSPLRFLIFSFVFHVLFTGSIFDIYFTSPVVHPSRRFSIADTYNSNAPIFHKSNPPQAPADRLVLIVGDGLRADTLFKRHDGAMMPAWARKDLRRLEADPFVYPWSSALSHEKDIGNPTNPSLSTHSLQPFFAAPHIRDAALRRGAWGLSHTRVPTESRPGHVALIAGMYEDVSAVTKGWKLNPVNFDSLFNVSTHAYTFGSPDILPMFAVGAAPGKVDTWTYDESAEDFTKDATYLDLWVLDKLRALFQQAKNNVTLDAQIRQPGNVFFLHLLGLDNTGHTYRPHSPEYIGNLMVVDAITRQAEKLFQDFFGAENQRTAWIFSADHGMSNKGNHGDGETDNTRTPLVAWGSGVRTPRVLDAALIADQKHAESYESQRQADPYFQGWFDLERIWRQDVEQADVATLMASLLSLPLPANSEGKLPLDYLDVDDERAARLMLVNAMEVLEIYRIKHEQRRGRTLRYVHFSPLPPRLSKDSLPGEGEVELIKVCIAEARYSDAVALSHELIELALQGSRYLQMYDWFLLVSIVTVGYLGSITYGIIFLLRNYALDTKDLCTLPSAATRNNFTSRGSLVVSPIVIAFYARFIAERTPWTYFLYLTFSAVLWARALNESYIIALAYRKALRMDDDQTLTHAQSRRRLLLRLTKAVGFTVAALELMVLGYLERWAWTIGFFVIGFPWAFFALNDTQRSKNEGLILIWGLMCVASGLFTLEGTEKEENVGFLLLSGFLFALMGLAALAKPIWFLSAPVSKGLRASDAVLRRTTKVIKAQVALIIVTTAVTASSSYHLQRKLGLPYANQALGWACLFLSIFLPVLIGAFPRRGGALQPASHRLTIIILAFAPILILLSIKDEALFFLIYTLSLLVWSKMEGALLEERLIERRKKVDAEPAAPQDSVVSVPRRIGLSETRTAVFFLFFLHVGFFGTGNVASISSFYLSPVYRLVPIFDPFLMAMLLIVKILVPFIVLCSVVHLMCAGRPSDRALGLLRSGEEWAQEDEDSSLEGRDIAAPQDQSVTRPQIASETSEAGRKRPTAIALELAGPSILGPKSIGGLGLAGHLERRGAAYPIVMTACVFTDILALNFLFAVRTEGAWLEIGRTITHFAMANLLQVLMYALTLLADVLYA